MKVDKFTKVVLTIIAVNLTILTVKNLNIIPNAYANEPTNNVEFTPSVNYGLVPLNEDGSINVKLINSNEIDVNITEISTSDPLNVHLQSSDSYSLNYAGPIEVEMN